jgi:hypothetical protein
MPEHALLKARLEDIKQKINYCPECGKKLNWRKHFLITGYDETLGETIVRVIYLDRSTFWKKFHSCFDPSHYPCHSLSIHAIGEAVNLFCSKYWRSIERN